MGHLATDIASWSARRWRLPNRQSAVAALVAGILASACGFPFAFNGDWWMYVRNETDQAWLVRVQMVPTEPDGFWVARLNAGTEGWAVAWRGERDVPVEILTLDCDATGVFRTTDGTSYAVDMVPGLTGHIEPWRPVGENMGEAISVTDCGGGGIKPD